ncbi:MAG: hypothetical protein IJ465_05960 [Clostridia bacterium]|nr:hypothetical protein [Clostridia bacterium]
MEEKSLKKYHQLAGLCQELEAKSKKHVRLFTVSLIVTFILSIWVYSKGYYRQDEWKALLIIVAIAVIISLVTNCMMAATYSKVSLNLTKNILEIKSTYISGVYTVNPKVPNNEQYFKIPYDQIERIEITGTDIKTEQFHNFTIYHTGGIIKLALAAPDDAKRTIYEIAEQEKNV